MCTQKQCFSQTGLLACLFRLNGNSLRPLSGRFSTVSSSLRGVTSGFDPFFCCVLFFFLTGIMCVYSETTSFLCESFHAFHSPEHFRGLFRVGPRMLLEVKQFHGATVIICPTVGHLSSTGQNSSLTLKKWPRGTQVQSGSFNTQMFLYIWMCFLFLCGNYSYKNIQTIHWTNRCMDDWT